MTRILSANAYTLHADVVAAAPEKRMSGSQSAGMLAKLDGQLPTVPEERPQRHYTMDSKPSECLRLLHSYVDTFFS